MSRLRILFPLLSCWLLSASPIYAAETDPLFQSSEQLAITLTADFSEIDDERNKETEYPGQLSYVDASAGEVVLDVKLRVRGNWRLDKRNCSYPPLWVDLDRSQVAGTLFENQNRIKMVAQCRRVNRYADYVYKELQAYQIFSELSDYHFDTRLLNVSFVTPERDNPIRIQPAFFIEHQNRLADKYGFGEATAHETPSNELDQLQSTLLALFMYLIGNTDFSKLEGANEEECCHNAKQLRDSAGKYITIPYDFDASGFVDTTYAPEPHPSFDLRNNRQRLYRGFCVADEIMSEAVEIFQNKRAQIMAIVSEDPVVSQRSTNRNIRYVNGFFETLDDPGDFERAFIRNCRG